MNETEVVVIPIFDVVSFSANKNEVFESIREIAYWLTDRNDEMFDFKLLIAPMCFSNSAKWIGLHEDKPMDPENFSLVDIPDITDNCKCDIGDVFKMLSQKLVSVEQGGWMKDRGGVAPIIILLSSGNYTEGYERSFDDLENNFWFDTASKFAVLNEGENTDALSMFTKSEDAVIDINKTQLDIVSVMKILISASLKINGLDELETGRTLYEHQSCVREIDCNIAKKKRQIKIIEYVLNKLFYDPTEDLF